MGGSGNGASTDVEKLGFWNTENVGCHFRFVMCLMFYCCEVVMEGLGADWGRKKEVVGVNL